MRTSHAVDRVRQDLEPSRGWHDARRSKGHGRHNVRDAFAAQTFLCQVRTRRSSLSLSVEPRIGQGPSPSIPRPHARPGHRPNGFTASAPAVCCLCPRTATATPAPTAANALTPAALCGPSIARSRRRRLRSHSSKPFRTGTRETPFRTARTAGWDTPPCWAARPRTHQRASVYPAAASEAQACPSPVQSRASYSMS